MSLLRHISTPQCGLVVSGGVDGHLRVWHVYGEASDPGGGSEPGTELGILKGHKDSVYCISEREDGVIMSGGEDGTVMLWRLKLTDPPATDSTDTVVLELFWECLAVLQGHTEPVFSVFELPGYGLVSASADHSLRLWSTGEVAGGVASTPGTPDGEGHPNPNPEPKPNPNSNPNPNPNPNPNSGRGRCGRRAQLPLRLCSQRPFRCCLVRIAS